MKPINSEDILKWPKGKLDFSSGCILMGVLNVTQDSFSDGGRFFDVEAAVEHALQMADAGAALIDIGGESTKPGSKAISADEQIIRTVPVIKEIAKRISIPISIDTCNYKVALAALEAGASMLNDVTALSDERMCQLAAEYQVPVVLMHMQGRPSSMQVEPKYDNVAEEVLEFLLERADRAEEFGVGKDKIFIDPGIGFGKTLEHNLLLLRNINKFVYSGYRVLVGTSRKNFIGQITGREKPSDRIFGTAATVALCAAAGVSIIRVHDVAQMVDVVKMVDAITD